MNKQETSSEKIREIFDQQKTFFGSQQTKDLKFRKDMLRKLKNSIQKHEAEIIEALHKDLHKSKEEAFLTEIGIIYSELDHHLSKLNSWAKPENVSTPMVLLPSTGKIISEPLGNALIVSPWNYPFQLAINPLIGAISAGNCAIVKPSPDSAHTALVIEKVISTCFDAEYVACIHGGKETNGRLFEFSFDVVCFTGSSKVGRIFMEKFARHLSRMILELGGKSPCIVHEDADLQLAARRVIWGKSVNAGQTCIAPDYLLVHHSVKEDLVQKMKIEMNKMFGNDIHASPYFGRMIHDDAFERVSSYLKEGEILLGGKTDAADKFIEPTVLKVDNLNSEVMQTEIFGPVLPLITYNTLEEAFEIIENRPKPLAFYFFGKNQSAKTALRRISSGGACINDTLMHVAHHKLPFGGVGNSGQGSYHGKFSFEAFSHRRAVVSTPVWMDLPFKYPPYKFFEWIKKMF